MADRPTLLIQVPRGSALEQRLAATPPGDEVVVSVLPADAAGVLEPPAVGRVVLSVPSPETLAREAAEVRRVLAGAGTGDEPLVVEVQAAEELRDDELDAVAEAATHASRPVILRVMRDA